MAYSRGAYAEHSSLPSPDVTAIPNARKIVFSTKRYELDGDGNPVGMDPTVQRVMLALSWGSPNTPRFLTDRDMEKRRQEITAALTTLVDEGAIGLTSVKVQANEAGAGSETVKFVNRRTGEAETVTRP